MFIPFMSSPRPTRLDRRKGGGRGGGGGGGGKGFKGSKGSKGSKLSINVGGSSISVSAYGSGGGRASVLPATSGPGPNFGGRMAGGGDRNAIYGSREYGSGYPGVSSRGVGGRGFPFLFWPVVWMGLATMSIPYLYSAEPEYGLPGSIYRPGGVLMSTAYKSGSTASIFRLTADNETTVSLTDEIEHKCSKLIAESGIVPVSNTSDASQAQPEQAVQYYRASSVVLTLDGYNNSATFGPEGAPDTQLPDGIDTALLDCLNHTIGEAVPLADSDRGLTIPNSVVPVVVIILVILF